jgi:hypothetical protein
MYFKLLSYFLLRMSLAMYAAPFDNDINQINTNSSNNDNLQGRKKVVNNKTIKKYPKDNEKVNSVLQTIQNLPSSYSSSQDDGNYLGDFTPLPPPSSAGVENTRIKEQTLQNKQQQQPQPQQEQQDHLNYGSKINSGTDLDDGYPTHPMYQQHSAQPTHSLPHSLQPQQSHMMPNYAAMYSSMNGSGAGYGSGQGYGSGSTDSNDLLIQKLNYMINLLEQSQDERTNNVTEEIVLYSFLGIFIIFIVDSFVRVGKYVR